MRENPIFKFCVREELKNLQGISFLPSKAHHNDTGYDVCANTPNQKDLLIYNKQYVKIDLGFKVFCPEGWWFELRPRSSTFAKKSLHCLYGVVDEGYENYVLLAVQFLPNEYDTMYMHKPLVIRFGEPIGQIVPIRRQEMVVEEVSSEEYSKLCAQRVSERGTGGFGSSSK